MSNNTHEGKNRNSYFLLFLSNLISLSLHQKKIVLYTLFLFFAVGVIYSLFQKNNYCSTAKVVREGEAQRGFSGGLSVLQSFGFGLGEQLAGVTVDVYPEVLMSREVRYAVLKTKLRFPDVDSTMTLFDYWNRSQAGVINYRHYLWKYTIELPSVIIELIRGDSRDSSIVTTKEGIRFLSKEEEEGLKELNDRLTVTVEKKTGVMSISVEMTSPKLSSDITMAFINELAKRVNEIHIAQSKANLDFIKGRLDVAQEELTDAENNLGNFLDRNINTQTAEVKIELDRMRRIVAFKTQVYSEFLNQFTRTEIEVEKNRPVITIIEAPPIPYKKSGPNRRLFVFTMIIVGYLVGVSIAYFKELFARIFLSEPQHPLAIVIEQLIPQQLFKRIIAAIQK